MCYRTILENADAQPQFEELSSNSSSENVFSGNHKHMTPFLDHKEGEGIFINPTSILRVRIERLKCGVLS